MLAVCLGWAGLVMGRYLLPRVIRNWTAMYCIGLGYHSILDKYALLRGS
jgi:hypothetical protein